MTAQKKKRSSVPPKSTEELEADAAHDAACASAKEAAQKLDATAAGLKRTISDSKMKAVRLPTPSQLDLESPPEKC
mgnify:CR=1 FL=1